jgi:hypothetical protein
MPGLHTERGDSQDEEKRNGRSRTGLALMPTSGASETSHGAKSARRRTAERGGGDDLDKWKQQIELRLRQTYELLSTYAQSLHFAVQIK